MELYKEVRPKELSQVKGNADVIATLEKYLEKPEKFPHTILLHGPTGCGKTTIARIISDKLGCKDSEFVEINSANFRGIDTIRDISTNCQFKPIYGKVRVYLIDECHKLTNDAQNAALKLFEDTPNHVYFILCTTIPDKLIPEIKGRCQTFQVKTLNDTELMPLLRKTVRELGESVPKEVYDAIIKSSKGHPRNALQILENVLQAPIEKRLELAKIVFNEEVESIELSRALLKGGNNWKEVRYILNRLKDQDVEGIRRAVLGYCSAILLNDDNARAGLIMDFFADNFYNSGFPGLVHACYSIIKS